MRSKDTVRVIGYDGKIINVVIGGSYSAIGTCGMTNGNEVKGTLTNIDGWGAYITNKRGIPHLCNTRTLKAI